MWGDPPGARSRDKTGSVRIAGGATSTMRSVMRGFGAPNREARPRGMIDTSLVWTTAGGEQSGDGSAE
jgi:hypothetical protein